MEYLILNNNVKMPKLGFGVYQVSKEECEKCVIDAIDVGYRLIDTAQAYFNEEQVGSAILKSGVSREEIFLTTKVWVENYGYDNTKKSVLKSMEKLQMDYLDLILLHQPFSDYYGTYRALEDLYKEGKVRAIGVSNFYPDRLADICAFNEVVPQVNQVEINPFNQQILAQKNMEKWKVQIESWAPFGEGRENMFNNEILAKIGEKYNKTVAQVILRWQMERNIVALAKTVRKERMIENFNIFDFNLSEEDMQTISLLDRGSSLFFNHQTPEAVDMFLQLMEARRNK